MGMGTGDDRDHPEMKFDHGGRWAKSSARNLKQTSPNDQMDGTSGTSIFSQVTYHNGIHTYPSNLVTNKIMDNHGIYVTNGYFSPYQVTNKIWMAPV